MNDVGAVHLLPQESARTLIQDDRERDYNGLSARAAMISGSYVFDALSMPLRVKLRQKHPRTLRPLSTPQLTWTSRLATAASCQLTTTRAAHRVPPVLKKSAQRER